VSEFEVSLPISYTYMNKDGIVGDNRPSTGIRDHE
jgi:hypothetical protein